MTYPTYGRLGFLQLNNFNRNINKIKYSSSSLISQPKGICIFQYINYTLVVIVDRRWSKVCAFTLNSLVGEAHWHLGSNVLEYEFTVHFGKEESPILVYGNNVKHQFLILTQSNAIFVANDTGTNISKLPYSELISHTT